MFRSIKILFLADTHLGFDLPLKPRINRRRRGHDFFNNYELALNSAVEKKVDLIVHGGDMFFRSRVHPKIVSLAFAPLIKTAEKNIPIFIVPGNHERSWIPASIFDRHPLINIFDRPKTYFISIKGIRLALAGFPYFRNGIRHNFNNMIKKTGRETEVSHVRVLCLHHIFEGAQVGIQNYKFRYGNDIIKGRDIPSDFDVVLSGHIHRSQALETDLLGNPLSTPVLYSGAIERTSFVERLEKKGYLMIELSVADKKGNSSVNWQFVELPTRPMFLISIDINSVAEKKIKHYLHQKISQLNPNAVVKVRVVGASENKRCSFLTADWLRSIAPHTMNIELSLPLQK